MHVTESTKEVLKWSINMAEKLNVHLTILHPYRLNQLEKKEDMVGVKKKIDSEAAKNFEQISVGLFNKQTVSFDFRPEVGFIQDRVQDYTRKNKILFLVIGTKVAIENKEILEELVKETEVPLVLIPSLSIGSHFRDLHSDNN
jgi:hypothetical protein